MTQALIFPIFTIFHLKFPLCVLEMNIWSFPPEPVTGGPLKLRDTALCLWHCGIYRRKRSNCSAEGEHEMVNTVSWRFTCLEGLFVSNVLTTGQQCCTMFAFLEMIVCFNVFIFFPLLVLFCCVNVAVDCKKKLSKIFALFHVFLDFFLCF